MYKFYSTQPINVPPDYCFVFRCIEGHNIDRYMLQGKHLSRSSERGQKGGTTDLLDSLETTQETLNKNHEYL